MARLARLGRFSARAGLLAGAMLVAASGFVRADQPALASCDGEKYRSLVGKPVDQLRKLRTENVRYVCTTCPMTKDFRQDRLTVTFFQATGRIKDLRCV
jgi:hypothetical protein